MEEEIYMEILEGYEVHGKGNGDCNLFQSLCKLKQTPKSWNENFNSILVSKYFIVNNGDTCR